MRPSPTHKKKVQPTPLLIMYRQISRHVFKDGTHGNVQIECLWLLVNYVIQRSTITPFLHSLPDHTYINKELDWLRFTMMEGYGVKCRKKVVKGAFF